MIQWFLILCIMLGVSRDISAQEELYIDVRTFDIVPGIGPQTKSVRFTYDYDMEEEVSRTSLNRVTISYDVAASMEIELDYIYSPDESLSNFVRRVKGYECGKEAMRFEKGKLTYRTFEPYEGEDCAGEIQEPVLHSTADQLDKVDFQRAEAEQIEAGRYRNLFKELSETMLTH